MIHRVERDRIGKCFASVGDIDSNIPKGDKLLEEVLLQKKAMYLNDLQDKAQTSYIYAVPFLDKRNTTVAILIVKEMPFLSYNQDTLLKINVVFNYIWTEYKKRASLDKIQGKPVEAIGLKDKQHERQDIVDFKLEVIRLSNILKDFNIDSRVYSIYTKNKYLDKEIEDFLYENQLFEVLDQYVSIKCGNQYIHLVLFPFVSSAGVHNTISDVDQALDTIESKLRVSMLEEGLQAHLSEKSYEGLRKKHISVKNFNNLLKEYACE